MGRGSMRPMVVSPVAIVVLLSAASAAAFVAPGELASTANVEAGAPGPYAGPGDEVMPDGWHPWGRDVHKQCGKYRLVFRNPDLQEDADGWIHAQGTFFIQFQVVGVGAEKVTKLSFSFGATHDQIYDQPTINCNNAIPPNPAGQGTGGAYLLYYRSDFDAKDGFFVPIKTPNVPDGDYAAAVHAYEGDCNSPTPVSCIEVARAWAKAKVDNCPGVSIPNSCPFDSPEAKVAMDKTMPWPMILPGDGEQTNQDGTTAINGLTIEFAEKMINDTVQAFLNGQKLDLQPWRPPARDDDLMPNNDNNPCTPQVPYLCSRSDYSDGGWKWLGQIEKGDVIRVEARDKNRNLAAKTVHYGVGTSGGTVDLNRPDIDIAALNGDKVDMRPGDAHEFNMRLTNIGSTEAHVSLLLNYTETPGFTAQWTDLEGKPTNHVVIAAGASVEAKVKVKAEDSLGRKSFTVSAIASYDVNGEPVEKKLDLKVNVDPAAGEGHSQQHDTGLGQSPTPTAGEGNGTAKTNGAGGDSPGPGLLAALGVVGLVAAAWARRRR